MKQQYVLFPCMVAGTTAIYLLVLVLNELAFTGSEYIRGINWIYLPAGVRLLCTLLFGGAGALGILIASWLACVYYYFPGDFIRAAGGSAISAGGHYLIYLLARRLFLLQASMSNLTSADRKRVVMGKRGSVRVDFGGLRIIAKNTYLTR